MALLYPSHASAFQQNHDRDQTEQISAIVNRTDDGGMDPESAVLIAQLGIMDLEELLAARKGKGKLPAGAPPSDEEYVLQMQYESLREWLAVSEDAVYARGVGGGVLLKDVAYMAAVRVAEEAALQDRRVAEMVQRGEAPPPPTPAQRRMEDPGYVMYPNPEPEGPLVVLEDLVKKEMGGEGDVHPEDVDILVFNSSVRDDLGELISIFAEINETALASRSSARSAPGSSVLGTRMISCTICTDQLRFDKAMLTPCDHYYCPDCVSSLVDCTTCDEELFPIRCCLQPIPIEQLSQFITPALKKTYLEKHAEFSVPVKNRLYCANASCLAFLGSSAGITGAGIVCPTCATSTCPQCKLAAHAGEDCVATASAAQLRALAGKEGWQTCPGCHMLVELNQGCYHMTCRCKAEFCYQCAAVWKTCTCPRSV